MREILENTQPKLVKIMQEADKKNGIKIELHQPVTGETGHENLQNLEKSLGYLERWNKSLKI